MITLNSDFDTTEAKEGRPYEPPTAGGHVMVVTGVSEEPSKTSGDEMVTLALDIADGEFQGAFEKYPKKFFQKTSGEQLGYFKAMLKYFKESNPESKMRELIYVDKAGAKHFVGSALIGCLVGANLRETEYADKMTGEIKVGMEIAFLCAIKDVASQKVMPLKKLPSNASRSSHGPSRSNVAPPHGEDGPPF